MANGVVGPVMQLVAQREENDCSIAALASIAGVTYEDALRAVAKVDPVHMGRTGLWVRQIEQAATDLGCPLRRRKRYDIQHDVGLLRVQLPNRDVHVVWLANGLIVNWDLSVWRAEDYLQRLGAKPGVLLVLDK